MHSTVSVSPLRVIDDALSDTLSHDRGEVCKALHNQPSILFLVDQVTELGGGERVLFELARKVPHYGFNTMVVALRGDPDPTVAHLSPDLIYLPLKSCFSLDALRVAWQLNRLIRRHNITIVQTFFESADLFGALVARLSGVRHVISSRRDMGILRSRKHRFAYRMIAPLYASVLGVSNQVAEWHRTMDQLAERQVRTIYNGLCTKRFTRSGDRNATRRLLGLPIDVPLVTTVANVNPWKGLDVFLDAAAEVHAHHPSAVFAIAGGWTDLALVASLQAQALTAGISDYVFFLGPVADVPALLMTSDLFALLSRSEGMPNVVLEAMAAGLPVVATAVGGTPEVVVDTVTGFLVANEDSASAAAFIGTLLSNASLRESTGLAGRRRVEMNFSLDQMISKHIELYRSLLDAHD